MSIYSGASKVNCLICGRPTWFGPRQRELIDAGVARPGCCDCFIDAVALGARPAGLMHLGNPEHGHRARRNDLGVTAAPAGDLYFIGPDLVIHRVDWTTSTGPRQLPTLTACGLTVAGDWKVAAGFPRRDVCADCRGEVADVG